MSFYSPKRIYTLAEANAAIASVNAIIGRLKTMRVSLAEAIETLQAITPEERSNGHRLEALSRERQIGELQQSMIAAADELAGMGIEIKDLERGIVDFPSRRDGRIVFLCWQVGETAIGYWHEVETGFAGRRPIDEHTI